MDDEDLTDDGLPDDYFQMAIDEIASRHRFGCICCKCDYLLEDDDDEILGDCLR
jgi:hypothetical protein